MAGRAGRYIRFETVPVTDRWNRRRWQVVGWFHPPGYPTVAEFHHTIATCDDAGRADLVVTALRQSLTSAHALPVTTEDSTGDAG